jgi:hypothetical protein
VRRCGRSIPCIALENVWRDLSGICATGILALDAAHLAAAEIGGAEVVLTCDDIMVRRARRLDLSLRVVNPVAYLQEVAGNG